MVVSNNGDQFNIAGFSTYKKFTRKLDEYMLEKVNKSFEFIFRVSGRNSSDFLSFLTSDRFIILQLLYAFSEKDIVYSNLLLKVSDSFEIVRPLSLSSWMNQSIEFDGDEIFAIMKYAAKGNINGMLNIPKPITNQLILMNDKYSIFEHACSIGDTHTVEWFLREGFDLSSQTWNILEDTWSKGHLDVVKILLENNFLNKVNLTQEEINKTIKNQTLLHVAAKYGLKDCAITLISSGADINRKDDYGMTPIFTAVLASKLNILKVFIDYGADMKVKDNSGEPLLHVATSESNVDAMAVLLDLGAPVDCENSKGITPLFKAVELDDIKSMYVLIFHGANLNYMTKSGNTPLHEACVGSSLDTVGTLVDLGATVDKKNRLEETPLYIAAKNKNLELMTYLLTKGADLYTKDRKGRTLLHRAAFLGDVDAIESLIQIGMPVNTKALDGTSALDNAAKEGIADVVKLLLLYGADPNASNAEGWMPLHRAVQWGFQDVVILLLDNGANPDAKSKSGWTPLALAKYYGHKTVADLIQMQLGSEEPDINTRILPKPSI